MIYSELKSNIINLGFEETDVFDDNEKVLIEAANRALIFLNNNVDKREIYIEYPIPESSPDKKYLKINLEEFTDFEDVSEKAPKIDGKEINNFYYEDNTLFISTEYRGNLSISYYAKTELIPNNPEEDYKVKIKMQLIPLLQLLTAYYVWLDDDERKAVTYYNQYSEQLQMYLMNRQRKEGIVRTVVEGGIDI